MVELALSVSANLASFRQEREVAEAGVGCDLFRPGFWVALRSLSFIL